MSPRRRLPKLAADRGRSLASLSLQIGRNAAYLQQFVKYGTPKRLPDLERLHLAMALQIDERLLGARDPWTPSAA